MGRAVLINYEEFNIYFYKKLVISIFRRVNCKIIFVIFKNKDGGKS